MASVGVDLDGYVREDGKCRVRITAFAHDELKRRKLDFCVAPKMWDHKTHRVKIGEPLHLVYNRQIASLLERGATIAIERPELSANGILEALFAPTLGGRKLHEAIAVTIEERRERFKDGTRFRLSFMVKAIEQALPLATLERLSAADVHRFYGWLSGRRYRGKKLAQNTLRNRMKMFRNLYHHACSHFEIGAKNLFKGVIPSEADVEDRSFTPEEFRRFERCQPPEHLRLTHHAFLLAVYLGGMRWSDLFHLAPDRVKRGLALRQQKTGAVVYADISDAARLLIDHYAGGKKVLPLGQHIGSANKRVNQELKLIAALADVPQEITFHWSRHAAADILEEQGVDLRMIQLLFGHSSIQQTVDYLDSRRRRDSGRALKNMGAGFRLPG